MNFSFFLAQRFFRNIGQDQRRTSNPTITIATAGVAIGLMVMVVSVCVILGFKSEITKKVEGFGSHIEVLDYRAITAPDLFPVQADSLFIAALQAVPNVKSVYRVAQKMGVIKTKDDFVGVTLKGLPTDYDTTFLANSIVEGRLPRLKADNSNEILISQQQAKSLRLRLGDRVFTYFFEDNIKTRRFTIVGIYSSNMGMFDKNYVFTDLSTIERLNQWDDELASVVEMRLKSFSDIDTTLPIVQQICHAMNTTEETKSRQPLSIQQHYFSVFAWLDLLDFNFVVILVLMMAVSGFTMVSGLFILILERTSTIGVLKALGATNTSIRHIFLNFAALITLRGLIFGNILAAILLFVQHQWGFFKLNPATYYVETIPIEIHLPAILLINFATLLITTLALVAPSFMISRIQPAKAIRFE